MPVIAAARHTATEPSEIEASGALIRCAAALTPVARADAISQGWRTSPRLDARPTSDIATKETESFVDDVVVDDGGRG